MAHACSCPTANKASGTGLWLATSSIKCAGVHQLQAICGQKEDTHAPQCTNLLCHCICCRCFLTHTCRAPSLQRKFRLLTLTLKAKPVLLLTGDNSP